MNECHYGHHAYYLIGYVQVTLAKPIISLLSKEYHYKQSHMRPNVIQVCED
jgi:hypothetical protein